MQPNEPQAASHPDALAQIISRLEAVEASNKLLTEEVNTLKHTVEELKQHSSAANGKPPNRVPTATGTISIKAFYLGKNPPAVETGKSGPKVDRVISTSSGTRPKPEEAKKEEPKDEKKESDKKKDTKAPIAPKPAPPKKDEPVKHDETAKKDHGAKPDPKAGSTTPITSKKDVKKPGDKPAPPANDKANVATKEKEPKKIMGGSKKDDKRPEPAAHEEKPAEVPKQTDEHLKLASESGEKHIEIERLELTDAPEHPAPVAEQPAAVPEPAPVHEQPAAEPPAEHQEHPAEHNDEPAVAPAEPPAVEEKAEIAQSELAADVGDLLS